MGVPWVQACGAGKVRPWLYAGLDGMTELRGVAAMLWLAEWPDVAPDPPSLPFPYAGWQYAGNAYGGAIDLDVFADDLAFMAPSAAGTVTLAAPPVAPPTKSIAPVPKPLPPFVGLTATPTGKGYWLLRSDGAVYAYGDAEYHGGANV